MATIKGTNNAETKYGTAAIDTIYGYGGNDSLYGRAGNDTIWGGLGSDKIWGEAGNDILRGEDGDDFIYGGDGNDVVYGGVGNDTLYGDAGTDTVKGDAGNDTIKGGTGIGYLYGGDGNDQIHYDPTMANVSSIGSYLSGSILDGDAGYDTLNVYNKAVYTSGGSTKAATTQISMSGNGGDIYFGSPTGSPQIDAGHFQEVEKITVTGSGKLEFYNYYDSQGIDITGTAGNDLFYSYGANDTLRGGAGNDDFHSYGGYDTIVSTSTDNDRFYFDTTSTGSATVTGFNGAGAYGGDRIYFDDYYDYMDTVASVSEYGNRTTFHVTTTYYGYTYGDMTVTVDKVGLEEGVDYFFV
ncbi:hypothetical protein IGS68_27795 (plasmid) [Skermanella sp. TT6]|uniref:Hemolysin type calcium-binding protein n=1 Tax=Skermanella cutis TaxID=2775420 RepID=A0ABX7BFL2_9PROT|nr:calcium-binding protein [Skermanella sp. TT6]QQP92982.1 hypothetical protein IGS68_27795 [Skermanella sp. TT6]